MHQTIELALHIIFSHLLTMHSQKVTEVTENN